MQQIHHPESEQRQQQNHEVVNESAATSHEIEMRVHPPGLVSDEVEEEGPEPHPKHVKRHEQQGLEYFHGIHVESVIDGDFAEHENERHHMDRYVEEYGHGTECDFTLIG